MAENKTQPTKLSVTRFLAALPDPARRADARLLLRLMKQATGERPAMWGPSIIGFGSHHYRYASGREGDTPLVAFAPRSTATVLYGLLGAAGRQALLARLGKHTTGKGCLYIRRLAEVDLGVLATLITRAVAARRARPARPVSKRKARG